MKKNFTYYYYATSKKNKKVELERKILQEKNENAEILSILDKIKFIPKKEIVDRIINYAKCT